MTAGGFAKAAERGTMAAAIAIIGYKPRVIQAMAAAGKIPGAAKFAGSRCWTFDLDVLRRWVKAEEQRQCKRDLPLEAATGAERYFGGAPRLRAKSNDGAYEQAMRKLLVGASTSSSDER